MAKRNRFTKEEIAEIEKMKRKNKDKTIDKRLEVLLLHAEGKKRKEIADKTGYGVQYVTDLVGNYKRNGLDHYATKHYKGNHRNMSFEEEEALLEPFKKQAEEGKLIDTSAILAAYEERLGRPAGSNSQIYYVLARHGWRKVMPRGKHPKKADDKAIEASKKLTKLSESRWKILQADGSG